MNQPYEYALYAEINRNRVYDQVIEALEKAAVEKGVTKSQIAQAIGRKPSQVSAWLSGPSNWTLDTISHLLRAVHATMNYDVVFDTDQRRSNIVHPASLKPEPAIGRSGVALQKITDTTAVQATGINGARSWPIYTQSRQPMLMFPGSGISNTAMYTQTQT